MDVENGCIGKATRSDDWELMHRECVVTGRTRKCEGEMPSLADLHVVTNYKNSLINKP